MYCLKIRWTKNWVTWVIRESYEKCIQAAAREARRIGMTYEIID